MYKSEEPTTYLQAIPDTPDATSIHSSLLTLPPYLRSLTLFATLEQKEY